MITNAAKAAKEALLQAEQTTAKTEPNSAVFLAMLDKVLFMSDFVSRVCTRYPQDMLTILTRIHAGMPSHENAQETEPALAHEKEAEQALPHEQKKPQPSHELTQANRFEQANVEDAIYTNYPQALETALTACSTEADLLKTLRQFRHLHMATLACLDILAQHDIRTSMKQVSQLADAIIEQAYLWIYQEQSSKYGTPEQDQHLQIMAMGKLGGGELNFSSDIDLIFAYPSSGQTTGVKKTKDHQMFFMRVAQKLIYALDHITEHGRCYRVDMRLRPMGDSGPLVMSYSAFETYYQEQGRAWERFAMQKMRIINQNQHTEELYDLIKPFVYRRYIDFTTIDSIREMKGLIEKEVRRRQLSNNIKLGQGGIREVEFFTQSLQLIHAGREPACQLTSTIDALKALCEYEFTHVDTANELTSGYLYLRTVEQYLQIFNDEQTQTLPVDEIDQQRLTTLLGCQTFDQCLTKIDATMAQINGHFSSIVEDANQRPSATPPEQQEHTVDYSDLWDLELEQSEAIELLSETLDSSDAQMLLEQVTAFKKKLQSASVSERGMRSFNRLMPLLLSEFYVNNRQLSNNQVQGIFGILQTIVGRIAYIDLLLENPGVRSRLFTLSRKSLWVAEQISQHPILLDELLHPVYLKADDLTLAQWKTQCCEELRQYMLRIEPEDVEAVMDTLRQFKHAYQLRIAAADITGSIAINQVSDKLTLLAEVMLGEVLSQAWRQVTLKHGRPQGQSVNNKGFGIIAYGKFGGIELSYGSDLDLVCLYNAQQDEQTDDSGSRKSLSHQEFYIKLVQRITHYCITKTYHGILYDIDLRLRPSGNAGLLISHISSFTEYQLSTAWTWEHQALVRGRFVIGDQILSDAFHSTRVKILRQTRETAKLREDVAAMRDKMRDHSNRSTKALIDIKQCIGGIVDIEFMVQFWVLNFAHTYEDLTIWSDNLRILEVCAECGVLSVDDVTHLQSHYLWLRHLAHRLQLSGRALADPSDQLSVVQADINEIYQKTLMKD